MFGAQKSRLLTLNLKSPASPPGQRMLNALLFFDEKVIAVYKSSNDKQFEPLKTIVQT